MVSFICALAGEGKTKRIIEMANEAVKSTDGHIVFIDDNKRHIYDLNYDIRFVETGSFPLSNYRELIGFICGIMSQDSDIRQIYIDGLKTVVKTIDNETLVKLVNKLKLLSDENGLDFVISMSHSKDDLPDEIRELAI